MAPPDDRTLPNNLVKWLVRVGDNNTPHLVVSHLANHPSEVPQNKWMPWDVAQCSRPVLLDHRTAAAMHGHAVSVVASLKRPGGPIIHAVHVGKPTAPDKSSAITAHESPPETPPTDPPHP